MWAAAEPLLPVGGDDHPLGCHNPRIPDRVCFDGILIRLVTGCSWVTAERLIAHRASDTTLRARRDEWVDAGVFDALADEALRAYDRIVGLDLSETAVDGSIHKAPCGGDGTGKSPVDPGQIGLEVVASHRPQRHPGELGRRRGEPQRHHPVRADRRRRRRAACRRGDPASGPRLRLRRRQGHRGPTHGIDDVVCAKRRKRGAAAAKTTVPLGLRWAIERTNSWLSNFGQLRRNTDRRPRHRLAQLALAIALLLTAKLIDWRNRWSPQ